MKITLEKNDLMEVNAIIPNEYYQTLVNLKSSVGYVFGLSKKQKEALDYVKSILPSFNQKQQDVLLEKLNLSRSEKLV